MARKNNVKKQRWFWGRLYSHGSRIVATKRKPCSSGWIWMSGLTTSSRITDCVQQWISYTNSYTDGSGCHARCRLAHQEHFGVQYLAQRHADQGNWTSDLPITWRWLYPWATVRERQEEEGYSSHSSDNSFSNWDMNINNTKSIIIVLITIMIMMMMIVEVKQDHSGRANHHTPP